MSELAKIYDDLSVQVTGLEGLSDLMCCVDCDEGLVSVYRLGVLLENELGAMRGLVDRLEVAISEGGEK